MTDIVQARIEKMRQLLETNLQPTFIEIIDDSEQHLGHAGAQTGASHFTLIINSDKFTDKNTVKQHQLIYAAIGDMIPNEIHALRIEVPKS